MAKPSAKPSEKVFNIQARQFAYEPPIIRVNKGDKVVLRFTSKDVTHGFYLDGYGINVEIKPHTHEQISFVADKVGRFGFRCSKPCGPLHPFMVGKFIVEPNYLYSGSIGLTIGLTLSTLIYLLPRRKKSHGTKV